MFLMVWYCLEDGWCTATCANWMSFLLYRPAFSGCFWFLVFYVNLVCLPSNFYFKLYCFCYKCFIWNTSLCTLLYFIHLAFSGIYIILTCMIVNWYCKVFIINMTPELWYRNDKLLIIILNIIICKVPLIFFNMKNKWAL